MTKRPVVSVMISVYNGMPYLGEAIASVLGQTYAAVELVVVDDGSTDGSGEAARSFGSRVTVLRHERQGIGASRNRAVDAATGQLFAFLDADDRMLPGALSTLHDHLERQPELEAAFGQVREFLSPDLDEDMRARLRPPVPVTTGRLPTTMLIHRRAFQRVGPYATHLRRGITLDWSARALEAGLRHVVVPEVLFERRLHRENNGLRERESTNHYVHVVKAALDRRRASSDVAAEDGAWNG